MFPRGILTLFFLTATVFADTTLDQNENGGRSFLTILEDKLEFKLEEYASYFTKWLENFNDKHLGTTELGRMLYYYEIKSKLGSDSSVARKESGRMKKMAMAMIPLVFHVGATSTWMMLTSILAAKSVAIGLALLIFKIAVSSAKLASFFTLLKSKHSEHHDWSWSPPHHEHHGHKRSFTEIADHHGHHDHPSPPEDWHSYSPEWTPQDSQPDHHPHEYHTIPVSSYKKSDDLENFKNYVIDEKDKKYS